MTRAPPRTTVDVAVDAMGGDGGPAVPVEAGLLAAKRGIRIALVGDRAVLERELSKLSAKPPPTIRIDHADDVIGMDEKPSTAVRKKRQASVCVAARLVASGEARALVSAGNSGAVMGSALIDIGRIPGVQRPALAACMPTKRGPAVVVDLGANIDPTPVQLAQFAVMGEAYAKAVLERPRPRVALLANGSEEAKGTDLTRAANELLESSTIDYIGYCEGRDIFEGEIDVIVTDGFTGNVVLKTLEGFVTSVRQIVEANIRDSLFASMGALLMRDVLRRVRKQLDYEKVGGAPLLGIAKRCLVAHGAASPTALANAIIAADALSGTQVIETIEARIIEHAELGLWPLPRASKAVPEVS